MPGLNDRWASRDYPVLEWIVQQFDELDCAGLQENHIAAALNITEDEATAAVRNLDRGGYIASITWMGGGSGFFLTDITERALRETGLWPNADTVADSLLWFLEQKVEQATSPEERSRWARIRDGFGAAGRDVLIEFTAAMATRAAGG